MDGNKTEREWNGAVTNVRVIRYIRYSKDITGSAG